MVRLQELGSRLPHAWAIASTPLPSCPPHLVTAVHPPPASLCPRTCQPNMGIPGNLPNPEAQHRVRGSLPACTPWVLVIVLRRQPKDTLFIDEENLHGSIIPILHKQITYKHLRIIYVDTCVYIHEYYLSQS